MMRWTLPFRKRPRTIWRLRRSAASRRSPPQAPSSGRPVLLCISQSFAPDTTPTAIRASKLLAELSTGWDVVVITQAQPRRTDERVRVVSVRSWRPTRLIATLRRLRQDKLLELTIWPDESIFWVLPALLAGRRLIRESAPEAIAVFMMPYSAGLAGAALSRLSGLPLILNLDDSPTCSDMHPRFPTRLHYRMAVALEDHYARVADAIVYVSETNLIAARARYRGERPEKFQLVRYGAEPAEFQPQPSSTERFTVVYVGAMSGWWSLIDQPSSAGGLRRIHRAWNRLGRYELTALDERTSSPAVIGGAIVDAIAEHPSWSGRLTLAIYGNPYPESVVARALASSGVESVVSVHGPVPHEQVGRIVASADLLFLTLPKRIDGSRGGRISAKTYEYLATDRPILAAVPQGENWDYLADKPGVWLVEPDDRRGMNEVIVELASAKLAGETCTFDRQHLRGQLSYSTRASEFATVLRSGIAHRRRSVARPQSIAS